MSETIDFCEPRFIGAWVCFPLRLEDGMMRIKTTLDKKSFDYWKPKPEEPILMEGKP